MKRKRTKGIMSEVSGLAMGTVGASMTLGAGSAMIEKAGYTPYGVSTVASFVPVATTLGMGNIMMKRLKPNRRKKR